MMKTNRYMMILVLVALLSAVLVGVIGAADLSEKEAGIARLQQRDPAQAQEAFRLLATDGLLLIPRRFISSTVMAFDPTTGDLVDPNFIPHDPTNLSQPRNVILNASGDGLLISDSGNDVIHEYDLSGNYVGVFAPAGGPDPNILDGSFGIILRPNGNLLAGVVLGPNANAVAEFDTNGNYLGNFIEAGAGGLDGPADIYQRSGDWLVSGAFSDQIHRFDLETGISIGTLAPIDNHPLQLAETSTNNILVSNGNGTQKGIVELAPNGALIGVYSDPNDDIYTGIYELANGNYLVTTDNSVLEVNRAGIIVDTKFNGGFLGYIEYIPPLVADFSNAAKSAPTTAETGSTFTYTIVLENSGNIMAVNTSMDDLIPTGLTYVPGSATGGAVFDPAANKIKWVGNVAPNSAVTITFQVDVTAESGLITNTASIFHNSTGLVDVSASTNIVPEPIIDLSTSSKTAPQTADSGSQFPYTIVIDNSGNANADGVTLVDPIPDGLTYVTGSATGGAVFNAAENHIEWTGDVAAGSAVTITFLVEATAESGLITNTATIEHSTITAVDVSATTNILPVTEADFEIYLPVILKP